ncbi:MAG: GDYXXLXY domain-containing protein [Leptospiraceae bacterium]|nr:GDYXXLXY domain-containing protein [Leptospiraceae bacterium]MCP5512016.1 GDYXXLXY domain-containing protein [Leptospiraceae bacterium]
MRNKLLILSVLIPIFSLLFLMFKKIHTRQTGLSYVLPISGFDPIDLLSGHYVTYRIDYGFNPCESQGSQCICLHLGEETASYLDSCSTNRNHCDSVLHGECQSGLFRAGIEKFFIPEGKAEHYDTIVRHGKSKIEIVIDKNGNALVKDLYLVE